MRLLQPTRFLPVLAACSLLTLLGCDGGLDFDNESLQAPSIAFGPSPASCSGVGTGTISIAIQDITVTQNFPGNAPQNRVDIAGTVSGLGMDDALEVLVLPAHSDCPIQSSATATSDGSTFSAIVDFGSLVSFRVVLVAHPGTLADIECSADSNCLSSLAGGFSAMSEAIGVELQ
jgi:hypothetical protein